MCGQHVIAERGDRIDTPLKCVAFKDDPNLGIRGDLPAEGPICGDRQWSRGWRFILGQER